MKVEVLLFATFSDIARARKVTLDVPEPASVAGMIRELQQTFPPLAGSTIDDVRNVGLVLFGNYNLPFQIIGILVLVATIGVVLLSRRELR